MNTKQAIDLVLEERLRQVEEEGWTGEHDDEHVGGQLAMAAACYATWPNRLAVRFGDGPMDTLDAWPWDVEWDKRDKYDQQRRLVIAAALIVAELERVSGR